MADNDRARARELAEERFGPALDEDQVQLLAAVRARRVRRFRRNAVTTIRAGEDVLDRGPDQMPRRVKPRLEALQRRGLVALHVPEEADQPGPVGAESWPWELTKAGSKALARAAPRRRRTT